MLISMLEVILQLDLHHLNKSHAETSRDGSQLSHESRRRPQRNAALKARERIINWAEDSRAPEVD